MTGDVAFKLKKAEASTGAGMYVAKPYIAVRGGMPRARTFSIGSQYPNLSRLGSLTHDVLGGLADDEKNRLIGFSILKLRAVKREMFAERVGTYVLAMPGARPIPVSRVEYVSDDTDGICRAQYAIEGSGMALNCVDFPNTAQERSNTSGLSIIEAAVSSHLGRANIVLRPHVHPLTSKELAQ